MKAEQSNEHRPEHSKENASGEASGAGELKGQASLSRQWLHQVVPANFQDVSGLTKRLLLEGKPGGKMAILYSMAALLVTPLDWALHVFEKQLYRKAKPSEQPLIFVCGAARSGTSLTAQSLMKHLPTHYFNNLSSIFTRSPLTANYLFAWMLRKGNAHLNYTSFYGRTTRLSYPNDALYLWDRWTNNDRKTIPHTFDEPTKEAIRQFFGAVEAASGKPLVNKNNGLYAYAQLVAETLPNACFICLDRNPLYLAQSQYTARKFIQGDERIAYGVAENVARSADPIEDICLQVLAYKKHILEKQKRIGEDRFLIVSYEDFCRQPAYWVQLIAEKYLGLPLDLGELKKELRPFQVSEKRKIDPIVFDQIVATFERLNHLKI